MDHINVWYVLLSEMRGNGNLFGFSNHVKFESVVSLTCTELFVANTKMDVFVVWISVEFEARATVSLSDNAVLGSANVSVVVLYLVNDTS